MTSSVTCFKDTPQSTHQESLACRWYWSSRFRWSVLARQTGLHHFLVEMQKVPPAAVQLT